MLVCWDMTVIDQCPTIWYSSIPRSKQIAAGSIHLPRRDGALYKSITKNENWQKQTPSALEQQKTMSAGQK
jgi:hypothetical protein